MIERISAESALQGAPLTSVPAKRLQGQETAVVAGYEAGASVDELAERFGVSNSPIRRILQEAGVQMRPPFRPTKGGRWPDPEHLVAAYKAGGTLTSIGRDHNVGVKTVRRWLVAAGIEIDPRRRRSTDRGPLHHTCTTSDG